MEEQQPYDRMCEALERIAGALDTLNALIASNQPLVTQAATTASAAAQAPAPGFRQRMGQPAGQPQQRRSAPQGQSNRKPVEVWVGDDSEWYIDCPFHQVKKAKVFSNDDGTTTVKCGERFRAQDGTQKYCTSSKVVD